MDQDYALFVRVVESGSISAAARALRLSPAMVSKRLARLEARLGTRLAHRTTRRLVTTEAGQRFYDDLVRILAAASEAEARVAGHGVPAGRLRVTAPTSFGRMHIAPHIKPFLDQHPRIALELDLSDGFTDLVGGRFDMAIRISGAGEGNLVAHRLAANRRILCTAPDYLAEAGAPATLADLARHRLLAAENQLPWRIEGPDGLSVIDGESIVRTNSSEVVRELAISGLGIALRSTWDIAGELRSGRLQRVLRDHEGASDVSIQAVYPRAALTPAPVRLFTEWLGRIFAPVAPWDGDA
ncbi:LysR family transcriptional regulator [Sphingomonas cavernae]|uniref:LysR family transcriptional regulator n=1 Tax=Sphingomonas cavernae TaxID=2320861 RepID=A0A418W616_9SPHN|nr:LysR family transcriptional regulator [Sphingomonas cavernae]RJF85388.1 LysR family transcriptional regulator [Sphingomonas cavernae]